MPKVSRGKGAAAAEDQQEDVRMDTAGAEQAAPSADGALAPMAVFPPISAGSLLSGKLEWRKVRGKSRPDLRRAALCRR